MEDSGFDDLKDEDDEENEKEAEMFKIKPKNQIQGKISLPPIKFTKTPLKKVKKTHNEESELNDKEVGI